MRRHIFFFLLLTGLSFPLISQTAADAVRFSYLQPGGTARFTGAGGAFGSLGADFGVLSTNPAGLAMYRANELVFTPSLKFSNATATLPGETAWDDDMSNFNFSNVGLVFYTEPRASARWTTFNVGIGLNRQQSYHQSIFYEGNGAGTILNNWFQEAQQEFNAGGNENNLYPFGARMGFDANAIYFLDGALTYDFEPTPNAITNRSQSLLNSGGINELVFSMAGNYDEKLMIGATVGVPFVNYRLEGTYEETDNNGTVDFFDNLTYTEYLRTQGIGVNLKLGVILRLNQMLRLGGAFHTPTLMGLTDNYNNSFSYAYTDANGPSSSTVYSPDGTTDYRLRTPWRAIASASVLLNKYGFLSADVEWVDYSANRYNFTSDVSSAENERIEREINNEIQRQLGQAMNIRLGGELVLDAFRLRAGYNLLGKAFENNSGFNSAVTAGAGFRADAFYLDLAYRRSTGSGSVLPYAGAPVAALESSGNEFLMTVGFRF